MSVEEKVTNAREVIADVGRLGARWVLWSRKRLGLALLAVLLVGLVLGQLTGPAHSGKGSRAPSATPAASNGISAGQPTATPARVDLAAAVFVTAWASHSSPAVWRAATTPLETPKLAALLATTDPSRVPATKVLPTPPSVTGDQVLVPTDAGLILVTLVAQPDGRQLADDVQRYTG
jgi:hypothetical protein